MDLLSICVLIYLSRWDELVVVDLPPFKTFLHEVLVPLHVNALNDYAFRLKQLETPSRDELVEVDLRVDLSR